jgi:hypothetical protein
MAISLTLLALLSWVSVLTRHAAAQDYRGKITAEVKDSSDALIPGAALTLARVSPKGTTTTKTDAQGVHIFQFLEPDTYTLLVSASGVAVARSSSLRQDVTTSAPDGIGNQSCPIL